MLILSLLPGQLLCFIQGLLNMKLNTKFLKLDRELQLYLQNCDLVSILRDSNHANASAKWSKGTPSFWIPFNLWHEWCTSRRAGTSKAAVTDLRHFWQCSRDSDQRLNCVWCLDAFKMRWRLIGKQRRQKWVAVWYLIAFSFTLALCYANTSFDQQNSNSAVSRLVSISVPTPFWNIPHFCLWIALQFSFFKGYVSQLVEEISLLLVFKTTLNYKRSLNGLLSQS